MTKTTTETNPNARWKDREFREFQFEIRASALTETEGDEEQALYVEGYACRFNETTVLYEYGDMQYKEKVAPTALADADMSDVIFNYNHGGKVMARTRNKTLELKVDNKGLFIRARLDGTEEGRKLYEEIKGGYIDRMSYAYTVKEASYDNETRTRTVLRIKKVYDVSAVDIPAYDTTSISARSAFEMVIEKEEQVAVAAERRKKLLLQTYL
ncbi:HK97 family phage prohead protease [Paenibacillus sp. JDR-2]|uniref:HK97 family phage prohead protease n=1 Tax=Paenibacillus sp. (strain JDR-2) TaxID=324057 RepID=UPI000166A501|nr:HK97 family phage prohead protease [Paenibacillus sp. JDR-2]ACT00214.1 phage prohead protease, HK97 family [Paenibacillus sp. JDR-2]